MTAKGDDALNENTDFTENYKNRGGNTAYDFTTLRAFKREDEWVYFKFKLFLVFVASGTGMGTMGL